MDLKALLKGSRVGLLREYDDNYYDKIRVYRSGQVKDLPSAVRFALLLRGIPGLQIEKIFFEDLELREEGALPAEEPGDLDEDLLVPSIKAPDTDLVKFAGDYHGKRIEIGIDKRTWEVWLRIWHLSDDELADIESTLKLT